MKIVKFDIDGEYGHFKIPYTNNNPLTHSFITKTALLGLMGAVLGVDRTVMKPMYPILSESLKYSVVLRSPLVKESISFYAKNLDNYFKSGSDRPNKSPKPMEHVKKPSYTVYVIVVDGDRIVNADTNQTVNQFMEQFVYYVEEGISVWRPTLGVKNTPCILSNVSETETDEYTGVFETKGFVTNLVKYPEQTLIHTDHIPTHQNDDWFNDPDLYVDVRFADDNSLLTSEDTHYKFNNEAIFAI
jgi:CRISPR-associated protein Cas5h